MDIEIVFRSIACPEHGTHFTNGGARRNAAGTMVVERACAACVYRISGFTLVLSFKGVVAGITCFAVNPDINILKSNREFRFSNESSGSLFKFDGATVVVESTGHLGTGNISVIRLPLAGAGGQLIRDLIDAHAEMMLTQY